MEIAKLAIDLARSSSVIDHRPLPVDDLKVRRPDIGKGSSLLRWEPVGAKSIVGRWPEENN